jgi:hypothetical protein
LRRGEGEVNKRERSGQEDSEHKNRKRRERKGKKESGRLIGKRRSGTSDPVVDWTVQRQRETVSSGK